MAGKLFLSRDMPIPTAETSSVSRAAIASTTRNYPVLEQLPFLILNETSKPFPKFNAAGRSFLIKFNSPSEEQNPATYLKEHSTQYIDKLPDR
jgi:hypothetical protein